MRLKLVRSETNFDFFSKLRLWVGLSLVLLILSLGSVLTQGLNFGIDFLGGTTIRTQSTQAVDVGAYRDSLSVLDLGDVSISEIFDPNFDDDQHVAMIRIQQQSVMTFPSMMSQKMRFWHSNPLIPIFPLFPLKVWAPKCLAN